MNLKRLQEFSSGVVIASRNLGSDVRVVIVADDGSGVAIVLGSPGSTPESVAALLTLGQTTAARASQMEADFVVELDADGLCQCPECVRERASLAGVN